MEDTKPQQVAGIGVMSTEGQCRGQDMQKLCAPAETAPGPWMVEPLCAQLVSVEQEIADLTPINAMLRRLESKRADLRRRLQTAIQARAAAEKRRE